MLKMITRPLTTEDETDGSRILKESNDTMAALSHQQDPGYQFAYGVIAMYECRLNEALQAFSLCRHHESYKLQAIKFMLDIYLSIPATTTSQQQQVEPIQPAQESAATLLTELNAYAHLPAVQVMRARVLIHTHIKSEIQLAMEMLSTLLAQHPNHIPAIVELIYAQYLLGQRANATMKTLKQLEWVPQFAAELERAYCLMIDVAIRGYKYDKAKEMAERVISYNASSSKAYEYLGMIAEESGHYSDAVSAYEKAWKYRPISDPMMGYRFAFCAYKAGQYRMAIKVGKDVVAKYPEYARVKREIVDKAQCLFRS
jgi:tetratricopeptide repeat protein 21B